MEKEINLLPLKQQDFLQKESTLLAARAIAVLSVILVVVTLVVLFILGKNYSVGALQSQQEAVRSKLHLLQDKTNKQLVLIERAQKIEKIQKNKIFLIDKLNTVQSQIPSTAIIDTITIDKDAIAITVSSPSLSSLQSFIDGLTAMVTKKTLFKKITINNLTLNQQTGNYTASIEGTFL